MKLTKHCSGLAAECGVRDQIMSEVFPYIVIAVLLIIIVLLSKLLSQLKYMTSHVYKTLNNTSDIDDIANHEKVQGQVLNRE
jgi:hypothetical protein